MRVSAPSLITFIVAVALGIAALAVKFGLTDIPYVSGNIFWTMTGAWALLVLACVFRRL
ncbi:hypothetical protein [Pseudovibrio flavus]|uniref:hypothetical protein n=1 Tax=Pseudovibrio flavus TaxID=2529854 RepID=UPI0012BBF422|nr:hypothetical protein [Pseudovibrio flavus]